MQILQNITRKKFLVFSLILLTIVIVRTINLDQTARFTQDESSDLMRIHQYFADKTLTLVGPISSDRSKVFGSLTYYMVMPFAAASNFEPIGPVWGTAFWGILTAFLLIIISILINRSLLLPITFLIIVWHPLLETSRWAWNPHLMLFWISLGILLTLFKKSYLYFFAGLFLGLAFHNHYISIIATSAFILICTIQYIYQKDIKRSLFLVSGFIVAFLPFLIFDLRHPPGLFFTNYFLSTGTVPVEFSIVSYLNNLKETIERSLFYLTQNFILSAIFAIIMTLLVINDFKTKMKNLIWLMPVLLQILLISSLQDYHDRYVLPALIFLFVWLILPRQRMGKILVYISFVILIFSNLLSLPKQLTTPIMPPNIYTITQASNIISKTINQNSAKNSNIAVLQADDSDTLGNKYRDILLIKHTPIRAASEYDATENLFVISGGTEASLREDYSVAMQFFKNAVLEKVVEIPNSDSKVYWFKK